MVVSGVDTLIRCCGIRVLDSMARITKVGRAREREKGSKDSNRGEGSLDRRVYAKRARFAVCQIGEWDRYRSGDML